MKWKYIHDVKIAFPHDIHLCGPETILSSFYDLRRV